MYTNLLRLIVFFFSDFTRYIRHFPLLRNGFRSRRFVVVDVPGVLRSSSTGKPTLCTINECVLFYVAIQGTIYTWGTIHMTFS